MTLRFNPFADVQHNRFSLLHRNHWPRFVFHAAHALIGFVLAFLLVFGIWLDRHVRVYTDGAPGWLIGFAVALAVAGEFLAKNTFFDWPALTVRLLPHTAAWDIADTISDIWLSVLGAVVALALVGWIDMPSVPGLLAVYYIISLFNGT